MNELVKNWKGFSNVNEVQKVGEFDLTFELDNLEQSINNIINTRKGSRAGDPDYGTNLHKYVFDPNDPIISDIIYLDILEALSKYERRIIINNLNLITDPDNYTTSVSLDYSLRGREVQNKDDII